MDATGDTRALDEIVGDTYPADARVAHAMPGRYYTDPDLHALEVERVFSSEWIYFCHQSQIANQGDYVVDAVAGQSVYAMRGADGEIRVFYNVCQHRGHELLTGTGTVANVVVCPYHSWSYGDDGSLRGAPKMRHVPNFCKEDVQLTQVRTEIIAGFVFVNLDEGASPLRELAPTFESIITSMVVEADQLQFVTKRAYDIKANWKVVVENFLEAYHVEFSGPAHRSLSGIIDVDTYEFTMAQRTIEYRARGGAPEALPYASNLTDDFTNTAGAAFHQVFLYPHMTFSVFPGTNMLFVYNMRPNGPANCAEEIIYFALDPDVSDASRTAEEYISLQLNHEDIELVEAVFRGLQSKGYRPGRLMVDEDQSQSWSEQFVHHFNFQNVASLRRPD